MTQEALFPLARSTDPETSHDAAASVTDLRVRQQAVLDLLRVWPTGLTDEDLVTLYQMGVPPRARQSVSGIRTRRSELVRRGLVEYAGVKRRLKSGRYGRVWRAVQ